MLTKLKPLAEFMFAPTALKRLADLLDNRYTLPGTKIRVGWDFLVGLIPVIGDFAGAILSSYVVVAAIYHGAQVTTVLRMLLNIVLDFFVGLIPVFGDLFDAGWMVNAKNVRLLLQDIENQAGSSVVDMA